MYVDKLDGKVEAEFYEQKLAEWRGGQTEMTKQIEAHQQVQPAPVADLSHVMARAAQLFACQPACEKRKLLDYVLADCVWTDGELAVEWRPGFGAALATGHLAAP